MLTKKILATSLLAFTFTGATLPSVVFADTTKGNLITQSNNQITQELISKIDPYIFIQNNQFILKLPENFAINSTQLAQINQQIQTINQQIQKDNGKVNVANKEITYPSLSQYINGGYTYSNFWWGTRYYFRSNAAVYQMDHDLDNYILGCTIGALATDNILGLGALYFQKLKSDLDYYNNTHLKNYIDMDVNWIGVYSIYTV